MYLPSGIPSMKMSMCRESMQHSSLQDRVWNVEASPGKALHVAENSMWLRAFVGLCSWILKLIQSWVPYPSDIQILLWTQGGL